MTCKYNDEENCTYVNEISLFFWNKISPYSEDWPWTCAPLHLASYNLNIFLYIVWVLDVWMVYAEVCVQVHTPMNTHTQRPGEYQAFSSITTHLIIIWDRVCHQTWSLPFQIGWLASKLAQSVCLHPQHWDRMLLSTRMVGTGTQVYLLHS